MKEYKQIDNIAEHTVLKELVWLKAFSTKTIVYEDHYYRGIAEDISNLDCFSSFNRPGFHWQTVRNFYENRVRPTKRTLEILATYAMGRSAPITWQVFLDAQANEKITFNESNLEAILVNGRLRIRVFVSIPIDIEIEIEIEIEKVENDS